MPVTVRWPGWAKNPATSAWKVRKVGWVKQGPNATSRSASERGRLSVSIGGDSLADEPPMLACLALPGKPVNSASHHHRKPRKHEKANGTYGRSRCSRRFRDAGAR